MRAVALLLVAPVAAVALVAQRGESRPAERVPRSVAPVAPEGSAAPTGLTPALRRSITLAIEAARRDGVELRISSGRRSAAHQQRLYEEAIAKYGSPEAARRWVLPPDESAHVRGEAVDVAPASGAEWLHRNGVRFGLCRRYANEPWHFERLAGALGSTCPPLEEHP